MTQKLVRCPNTVNSHKGGAVCVTHLSHRRWCRVPIKGQRLCSRIVSVTGYTRWICCKHEDSATDWNYRYGSIPTDVLLTFGIGQHLTDAEAAVHLLEDETLAVSHLAARMLESELSSRRRGMATTDPYDRHQVREHESAIRETLEMTASNRGLTGADATAWVEKTLEFALENIVESKAESTQVTKDRALDDLAAFVQPLGYDLTAIGEAFTPISTPLLVSYFADRISRGNLRTGEPLTAATVRSINTAVKQLHTTRGISDGANPACARIVKDLIAGYSRRQDRPPVRATPFTRERVYSLVTTINMPRETDQRDIALLTVAGNPTHPVSWERLATLKWEQVVLPPVQDPIAPMILHLGGQIGTIEVAQRGLHDGVICPVAAMRTLLGVSDHTNVGGYNPTAHVFSGVGKAALKKRYDRAIQNANMAAAADGRPPICPTPAAPRNVKRGLTDDEISFAVSTLEADAMEATRDTAALLLGWWGSLRVGEIASINLHWLVVDEMSGGYLILLHSSKTDVEHRGAWVELPRLPLLPTGETNPLCPSLALERWLAARINAFGATNEQPGLNNKQGPSYNGVPLFVNIGSYRGKRTTPSGFQRLIKRVAEMAGIEPRIGERISWNCSRAGFATHSLTAGLNAPVVAYLQRRKDINSVMPYYRPDNVSTLLIRTLDLERTTAPISYPALEEVE